MKKTETVLFALFCAALHGEPPADPGLSPEEWQDLLRLAERHKLLPLILDAAWDLPSCRAASVGRPDPRPPSPVSAGPVIDRPLSPVQSLPLEGKMPPKGADEVVSRSAAVPSERSKHAGPPHPSSGFRETPESTFPSRGRQGEPSTTPDWQVKAIQQATDQALRENDFLNLILGLQARGLDPIVLKGAVCRALYPRPMLRPSQDDDLLIPAGSGPAYHRAMLELGLWAYEPDADLNRSMELCYCKDGGMLVELNTSLFDPDSEAVRDFNEPFAGAADRAVSVQIQDVTLRTLAPTDHLLFLILHAFKHFLYSGFGLRIVADVCLYARHYAEEIDFARVRAVCEEKRCDRFTAALCQIGGKYLDLPVPEAFALPKVDESALLADILDAGIHGEAPDRLHSASFTVAAVESRKTGSRSGGLRRTLFPGVKTLTPRYPWLEKRPWLLPAAWACRIGTYLKTRGKYGNENPAAAVRIGRERVKLLRSYGIIDRES